MLPSSRPPKRRPRGFTSDQVEEDPGLRWYASSSDRQAKRITKLAGNHNETLVREPAERRKAGKAGEGARLPDQWLEERIRPGVTLRHNETLVREPAETKPNAAAAQGRADVQASDVKLEERITREHSSTTRRWSASRLSAECRGRLKEGRSPSSGRQAGGGSQQKAGSNRITTTGAFGP